MALSKRRKSLKNILPADQSTRSNTLRAASAAFCTISSGSKRSSCKARKKSERISEKSEKSRKNQLTDRNIFFSCFVHVLCRLCIEYHARTCNVKTMLSLLGAFGLTMLSTALTANARTPADSEYLIRFSNCHRAKSQ